MKKINSIFILILALIVITSCDKARNVNVNTVINEDGTCTREVSYETTMTQENRDINWGKGKTGHALPVPENIDVESMTFSHNEIKGDTVKSVFTQKYASVEEMHNKSPFMLDGKPLKSKVEYKKENSFFYTTYTYAETFESLKDELPIPVDSIGNKDIVQYWFRGYPDINIMCDEHGNSLPGSEVAVRIQEIEEKVDKWVDNNIITVYFNTMAQYYDSIQNPPVTKDEFLASRKDFIKYFEKNFEVKLDTLDTDIRLCFDGYYKSNAYDIFFDDGCKYNKEIDEKIIKLFKILDIDIRHTVTMPGKVCAGNRIRFNYDEDGTGHFRISGGDLITGDMYYSISTRQYHPWAFVLTGLVIMIAVCSIIYGKKMKK